ncbi:MAG: hypothetical protein LBI12_02840 [Treponema sp.]|jgi:hypothetical protein|nr:hypothetical protein [Treponema sp.]
MTADSSDFSLLKQVPAVLRARGFRLYTKSGRLIDLWQNGGAAVLGHTPVNMLRELKNAANRGLYAPFPHFYENRYLNALSKIFKGRSFRLYAAPPQELVDIFSEKRSHSGTAAQKHKKDLNIWRPFLKPDDPFSVDSETSLLIPVLPGIHTWRNGLPVGLCIIAAKSENLLERLPPDDILSPVLLATAARGVYDLLAAPERAKPVLPHVNKVLQSSSFSGKGWRREGIYLFMEKKPESGEWAALFKKFLDAGFLLPPTPLQPVILPGELSAGESARLAALLSTLLADTQAFN